MTRAAPYLLLDAGGTLVCPNVDVLLQASHEHGYALDPGSLISSFFARVHRFDGRLRDQGSDAEAGSFLPDVLVLAGVGRGDASLIVEEAIGLSGGRSLWAYPLPGVEDALGDLHAAGYRMSVVSNSDGTVMQQMADLDLSIYFERVFDSAILGIAKPDPGIFRRVLADLDLAPGDCLYTGDVVMVDVVCANACRIPAVHLDPLGLYGSWPGYRTKDLPTLARMLARRSFQFRQRSRWDRYFASLPRDRSSWDSALPRPIWWSSRLTEGVRPRI